MQQIFKYNDFINELFNSIDDTVDYLKPLNTTEFKKFLNFLNSKIKDFNIIDYYSSGSNSIVLNVEGGKVLRLSANINTEANNLKLYEKLMKKNLNVTPKIFNISQIEIPIIYRDFFKDSSIVTIPLYNAIIMEKASIPRTLPIQIRKLEYHFANYIKFRFNVKSIQEYGDMLLNHNDDFANFLSLPINDDFALKIWMYKILKGHSKFIDIYLQSIENSKLFGIGQSVYALLKKLYANKIYWNDIHPYNFALNKKGNLVALDIDSDSEK